ncbi:MAG TPA: ClpX C4-type zinc finger protein [Vicinamibacterales bacterium]|nr:ClpX C4-type zinc finger protein [Vicinamibacterales bacterium]
MTLDERLVRTAEESAARLAAAERDALLARADYHTAVRRLHLGGGSLREIAQRLGISHQRVQQIVSAAGGSWWQRVWRTRLASPDAVCTFCERPPSEVKKLIAGPKVYICDACVALAEAALAHGSKRGAMAVTRKLTRLCSFCRRRHSAERRLVEGHGRAVCEECLRVCREILDGRAA